MGRERRIAIAMQIDEPYPQHQEVYAGVLQYAREQGGWRCLIDEHPGFDPQRRGDHYRAYDGVIGRATPRLQKRMKHMGVPLVNVHYQTARPGLAGVYPDPEQIGRLTAEHLIERGFRRLSILVDRRHNHSWEVCQAFLRCAQEHDIECTTRDFPEESYLDPHYWVRLERFLLDWLDTLSAPVGLFIELSPVARQMIELSYARGWHVPQQLAVLTQLNLKAVVDVPPQISSVESNYPRVGYEAAALLDRLMAGEPVPAKPILIPPRSVVARESTDYFAVEDQVVAGALRYIAANLSGSLRLPDIADHLAVSSRSLQMHFKQALGRGISEEIRRLRLEAAKRLLADPDPPIGSIASRVGFGSAVVMNQIFRRELGITPGAYRQRALGDRPRHG